MTIDNLLLRIAAELRVLAGATESLAEKLCQDEEVALLCLPLLQQFDFLAQHQTELATLILRLGQGDEIPTALGEVRLATLAERLQGVG